MKKPLFTAFFLLCLFSGCQEEPAVVAPEARGRYFDVPAFVKGEIAELEQTRPQLRKTVAIRHKKPETHLLSPASWAEELQYFTEIDLNKKALQEAYAVSETSDGPVKITRYSLKPGITAPISFVELRTDAAGNMLRLKALAEQKNVLIYTREWQELTFNAAQQWESYRISGVQKVLLSDSLQYETIARAQ